VLCFHNFATIQTKARLGKRTRSVVSNTRYDQRLIGKGDRNAVITAARKQNRRQLRDG